MKFKELRSSSQLCQNFSVFEIGHNVWTMAVDISNWKRIGYKKLSAKPVSTLSVSLDGKYLAL
jgi:hypothetical protein